MVRGTSARCASRSPAHHRVLSTESLEVVPDDAAPSPEDVTFRELLPSDAPALTRALYRTYGWSYPMPSMYYPDRIAAQLESGQRIGEVAVTASGEVASHWGAVYLSPPSSRREAPSPTRGSAAAAWPRSWAIDCWRDWWSWRSAAACASRCSPPGDAADRPAGGRHHRRCVHQHDASDPAGRHHRRRPGVARLALGGVLGVAAPGTGDDVDPRAYEPMARQVLAASDWPRELAGARRDHACPEHGSMSTSFNSDNRFGIVDIDVVGLDLVDEITTALHQMQRSGAEYVQVRLPANQPALATVGAGLVELGLGYAALIPGFRPSQDGAGDVLVTQWIEDIDVDTSDFVYATEAVGELVRSVVQQVQEADPAAGCVNAAPPAGRSSSPHSATDPSRCSAERERPASSMACAAVRGRTEPGGDHDDERT